MNEVFLILLGASVLVVGESLTRAGVAQAIGCWMMKDAGETRKSVFKHRPSKV